MPRKEFEAFTRLDASDVNSFLMDQTVMSFAGTAARGSAIGTATEGMVSFLEDSNLLSIYDGSVWRPSLATTGGVLQVVRSGTGSELTTSSSTFVDTNLTATITPKSISSQILIFISQNGLRKTSESADNSINLRLVLPNASTQTFGALHMLTGSSSTLIGASSYSSIYTPNSLSAQTFKTQIANFVNGASVTAQLFASTSSMVLMEIAS
jgi:hypothetical protein